MSEAITLDNLKIGQFAIITEIMIEEAVLKRRIQDMGFVKGEIIKIVGVAPLGDPVAIAINDCRVAVRKQDLAMMTGVIITKENATQELQR